MTPGTAVWFARHESRLAWRDWLSMITAGRRERLRRVVFAILVFAIFMHFVAYWMVGRYADTPIDKPMLVTITATVLLSWLLMISQAALAVGFTVALFRIIGPRRTRLVAQVVAAVIGAAFVIGLQVAAILSYGTISRVSVLQSSAVLTHAPDLASIVWWPARAAMGDWLALIGVLAVSFALFVAAIALVSPRFGEYATAAAGAAASSVSQTGRQSAFKKTSPRRALRRKEWTLLRRDPWLVSQTFMQMLYLIPPAVLLWRSFDDGNGAYNLLVPVLVMAAGQLAGGLAWLAISGEDAPDLVATAPVPAGFILRAKVEAVLGVIAVVFAPMVAVLAILSPWHALVASGGIVIATTAATAIQLWFRSQAKRSQFRRRQVSSRVATFTEAFSSIGWAATAAVASVSLVLAIAPALIAFLVVAGAWIMSPRAAAA